MLKRTNKLPVEDTIIVASGDQALPTGSLVTTGTNLNLANGQVGVLSYDANSTVKPLGRYLASGDDSKEVTAIKVVQGTPKSAATQTVSLWEEGDKALVESGIIRRNQVTGVSVKKASFGQWSGVALTNFPTPANDVDYGLYVNTDSTRIDTAYPQNDNTVYAELGAINFTTNGITQPKDYTLQKIASQLNSRSKLVARNGNGVRGNKDYVVFGVRAAGGTPTAPTVPTVTLTGGVVTAISGGTGGSGYSVPPVVATSGGSPTTAATIVAQIDAAGTITGYTIVNGGAGYGTTPTITLTGGGGQALGTITPTTNINFELRNGVYQTIQLGEAGVTALAQLVNANANLTTTSTIEVINSQFAGGFAKIDSLIVLGVPHTPTAVYDDVNNLFVTVKVEVGPGFTAGAIDPTKTICPAVEPVNSGRVWLNEWRWRPGMFVHTMQVQPMGDFFAEGVNYINVNKLYTNYTITYQDTEQTLTGTEQNPKRLTILLPCEKSSAFTVTVANIDTRLTAGSTPIPMVTSNDAGTGTASANTVAGLEAVLSAWLEDNRATGANAFPVTGDAVAGGVYLS